ncbi:type I restriction endonuclease [Rhodoferax sp.]|uniref:type I restriction enzyme HsdR N-terminal domain-containing protein n=1 Tax=Rhodoferax sp. TaxID=50421 RepID=UPI0026074C9D|nr:type I restriction endonuclease [Rhodoferax sp.]MDD2809654.1 type I restriction enzyme HsdR N-terminal domain-containing protein [Rhodoferax sp.]
MQDLLKNVANNLRASHYKNEEHIRLGIVYRLLHKLGWDIWNPHAVRPEHAATPREDATRVDVALFMPPQYQRPAVFIEVKARGKLESSQAWKDAETQLRDYNRNNSAEIAVLTDGRYWRFYLPGAAGEFSDKCFEKIDFLSDGDALAEVELVLDTFISQKALQTEGAVKQAKEYLKRSDAERIMFDVLPVAQRDMSEDETFSKSLLQCFIGRCLERGIACSEERAKEFIRNARNRQSSSLGSQHKVEVATSSPNLHVSGNQGLATKQINSYQSTGKSPTPDHRNWVISIPELQSKDFRSWKHICEYLKIDTGRDSARRALAVWVQENKPIWTSVPDIQKT